MLVLTASVVDILLSAAGVITAATVVGGGGWWLLGPRIRQGVTAFVVDLLAPFGDKLDAFDERNTIQHAEGARDRADFLAEDRERWAEHAELHSQVAEDVGKIKGKLFGE